MSADETETQGSIDLRMLKKLQKFMEQGGLVELEVEMEGVKVRLKKGGAGSGTEPQVVVVPSPTVAAANGVNGGAVQAVPAPAAAAPVPAPSAAPGILQVKSPMVGTFYRSTAPEQPPFVAVGDVVKEGQTLCLIEAMKLMNEIKAEKGGRVLKVHVENGQPVEFEQPLMDIDTGDAAAPAA